MTLRGNQFTGATAVYIGGATATDLVVVSPTEITCTTPAGTPNALVNVNVMRGIASNPAQYQYLD